MRTPRRKIFDRLTQTEEAIIYFVSQNNQLLDLFVSVQLSSMFSAKQSFHKSFRYSRQVRSYPSENNVGCDFITSVICCSLPSTRENFGFRVLESFFWPQFLEKLSSQLHVMSPLLCIGPVPCGTISCH